MTTTESPLPPRGRSRRQVPLVLVIVVAMVATAALVGGGLYFSGAFATEVVAQPFDDPGIDPFGESVGDGQSVPITPVANIKQEAAAAPPVTDPAVVTPPQAAAPATTQAVAPESATPGANTVTGDTVGLYGGTNQNACDAAKLVAFLKANPDKARAWAGVELVPVDQIEAFVATLTPVILRTDTAVINHGFRNGVANPFNAVLQAGTAVMVDRNGVPRVRCKCGNPLLPPKRYDQVKYTGTRWFGFDDRNITYIDRSPTPITTFRVVILCNCGYGPPTVNTVTVPGPPGAPPIVVPGGGTGTVSSGGGGGRTTRPTAVVPRTTAPGGGGAVRTTAPAPEEPDSGGGDSDGGGDRPVPPQTPAG